MLQINGGIIKKKKIYKNISSIHDKNKNKIDIIQEKRLKHNLKTEITNIINFMNYFNN